jgi:hypothetical protein
LGRALFLDLVLFDNRNSTGATIITKQLGLSLLISLCIFFIRLFSVAGRLLVGLWWRQILVDHALIHQEISLEEENTQLVCLHLVHNLQELVKAKYGAEFEEHACGLSLGVIDLLDKPEVELAIVKQGTSCAFQVLDAEHLVHAGYFHLLLVQHECKNNVVVEQLFSLFSYFEQHLGAVLGNQQVLFKDI